ncbi:MAG: PAS domain S-box protein [Saprospiraceae bacterium]
MNRRFIQDYFLIAFIGLTSLYFLANAAFFPEMEYARLNLPIINGAFLVVSIAYLAGLSKSAAATRNRDNLLLLISIAFCSYLSAGAYFKGYDDALIRLVWIMGSIAGVSFLRRKYVVIYLSFSTIATSAVHVLLPAEKFPYPVAAYLVFTPLITAIYYYVVSLAVITTKKLQQSERHLRHKTKEMDAILNSMHVMVAYKNADNVLLKVNDALARHLGKPSKELVGQSIYDLFPSSVAKKMHKEDLEVIRTGKPMFALLSEIKRRGKPSQWLNIDKMPYCDEFGKITGVVVTVDDVTERFLADKKLKESEERFRMIFENAPDGMGLVDCASGKFLKVNQALTDIVGYSEKELLTMTPTDLTHPSDLKLTSDLYSEAIQNDLNFYGVEKRYVHKNGRTVYIYLAVHIVYDDGLPKYKIGIIKDVTLKKENERKLKKYARQLEESNQNLQEFAYAASHDLREPLRTVVSYVQLLKRSLPAQEKNGQVNEFMNYIVGGAKRMEKQITALLDYSRIGNSSLHFEQLDLKDTIFAVCQSLKTQIIETNASLEIRELPYIVGDAGQIEGLFQNLISNSMKYKKQGVAPVVKVGAEQTQDGWHFTITDNGIGIEEEYLKKIFAVFRRLHSQDQIPGNGVGLAICHRIIQRHAGKIWATSTPGEGTTMHFTLPTLEHRALFYVTDSAPDPLQVN